MKRFTFSSVLLFAFLALSTFVHAQFQDDDHAKPQASDSAPTFGTYKTNGNYHQGDMVIRDYKLTGGSAGPFVSLTGHNAGVDPIFDFVNWYFIAGACNEGPCSGMVQPTNEVPAGAITSSATGVVVPVGSQVCVPASGNLTLTAAQLSQWCNTGGGGLLPNSTTNTYSFVVDISPKVPNDGSFLNVLMFDSTLTAYLGSCQITAGLSECSAQNNAAGNKGDASGVVFMFIPGTLNLPNFSITSAHWSVVPIS